jgi:hypothetical protein
MKPSFLDEIENRFDALSLEEQLQVLERLVRRLRKRSAPRKKAAWGSDLAAMAADSQIQEELRKIDAEFRPTEGDGLEPY